MSLSILKHLVNWLNANKISANVKKTELLIFKSKQKKLEGDLKIKLSYILDKENAKKKKKKKCLHFRKWDSLVFQ